MMQVWLGVLVCRVIYIDAQVTPGSPPCALCSSRCPLETQIDAFRTVAEPYTASAFKVGRRINCPCLPALPSSLSTHT
jgi:hypothetical protein